MQYKCAIKRLWQDQVARGINSRSWDLVFTKDSQALLKMVTDRKTRQATKNFAEKIDNDSAALANPDTIAKLEQWLFDRNRAAGTKSVFCGLRHRFVFLHTSGGLLHGESVYKAELSDLFHVFYKADKDVHPLMVVVQQLASGKTNNNQKLYGRVMRHKDVNLCAVGALGFYLMYRFQVTDEMNTPPDFADNEAWYRIKLLVQPYNSAGDYTQSISDRPYMEVIKTACMQLNLSSNHWLHIGRVLGTLDLESSEADSAEIRLLGNWDPSTQEKAYSIKVPLGIIRKKACFRTNDGAHYNPRTAVTPPSELLAKNFPWAPAELDKVKQFQFNNMRGRPTAIHFLELIVALRREVVVQDAAAMMILNPERATHTFFQMEVFRSPEFALFKETMRSSLQTMTNPRDSDLRNASLHAPANDGTQAHGPDFGAERDS
jgi:Centromere DNA-binding protein complex CBF3 subunit, domain 2